MYMRIFASSVTQKIPFWVILFWLSMREQMYNCQKWLANSLKAGSAAPVGRYKVAPTGAISPQKCGCWHFENAVGREKPAKSRPMDSILGLQRAR